MEATRQCAEVRLRTAGFYGGIPLYDRIVACGIAMSAQEARLLFGRLASFSNRNSGMLRIAERHNISLTHMEVVYIGNALEIPSSHIGAKKFRELVTDRTSRKGEEVPKSEFAAHVV